MKNVLLVDDDNICNFLSTQLLERLGFVKDIHAAANGAEALDLFNNYFQGIQSLPDIILLDLSMPIMDGFGFLEAFQKLNIPYKDKVTIIIVTSSQNPTDIARAKSFGITKYLTKPINEADLLTALEN